MSLMEGRAPQTHAQILRGRVCGNRAGHELRLLRGSIRPAVLEAECGAGGLAGEGAEACAAEVAVTARCCSSFAHLSLCSRVDGVEYAAMLGPILVDASVAADEN